MIYVFELVHYIPLICNLLQLIDLLQRQTRKRTIPKTSGNCKQIWKARVLFEQLQ